MRSFIICTHHKIFGRINLERKTLTRHAERGPKMRNGRLLAGSKRGCEKIRFGLKKLAVNFMHLIHCFIIGCYIRHSVMSERHVVNFISCA